MRVLLLIVGLIVAPSVTLSQTSPSSIDLEIINLTQKKQNEVLKQHDERIKRQDQIIKRLNDDMKAQETEATLLRSKVAGLQLAHDELSARTIATQHDERIRLQLYLRLEEANQLRAIPQRRLASGKVTLVGAYYRDVVDFELPGGDVRQDSICYIYRGPDSTFIGTVLVRSVAGTRVSGKARDTLSVRVGDDVFLYPQ